MNLIQVGEHENAIPVPVSLAGPGQDPYDVSTPFGTRLPGEPLLLNDKTIVKNLARLVIKIIIATMAIKYSNDLREQVYMCLIQRNQKPKPQYRESEASRK